MPGILFLLSFLSEPHAALAPDSLLRSVASTLALSDPEAAFQWADDLPGDRPERAAGHVFSSWLRNQPELAGNWLQEIPASDGRRPSFVESFIGNSLWGPEEVLFQRLETLKPGDSQMVEVVVGRAVMPEEKKRRILDRVQE